MPAKILTTLLALLALLALTPAAPADARSSIRVGVADQSPRMFESPFFQQLNIRRTRYFAPSAARRRRGCGRRSQCIHVVVSASATDDNWFSACKTKILYIRSGSVAREILETHLQKRPQTATLGAIKV